MVEGTNQTNNSSHGTITIVKIKVVVIFLDFSEKCNNPVVRGVGTVEEKYIGLRGWDIAKYYFLIFRYITIHYD